MCRGVKVVERMLTKYHPVDTRCTIRIAEVLATLYSISDFYLCRPATIIISLLFSSVKISKGLDWILLR